MKKIAFIALFFIILSSSLVCARIYEDFSDIESKISDFVNGSDKIIIKGAGSTSIEKALIEYMKDKYPAISDIKSYDDIQNITNINITGKTVFLLGGPTQNKISYEILKSPHKIIREKNTTIGHIIFLISGNHSENQKYIIISDRYGFNNLPQNLNNSPLKNRVPDPLIPSIATGISLLLIWLGKFLGSLLFKISRFKIASKIMSKVKKLSVHRKFRGFKIMGVRVKYRELIAILVAAIIFASANAYSYITKNLNLIIFLTINIGSNIIIYLIRHGARLIMDRKHNIHTEYVVWPYGAIVTIITGWFGSTFCMAGYIAKDDKEHHEEIPYLINLFTFLAFLILFILNFLNPKVITQMAMNLALSISFLQMIPMTPFSGKRIYKWNKKIWWSTFIPMLVFYIGIKLIV